MRHSIRACWPAVRARRSVVRRGFNHGTAGAMGEIHAEQAQQSRDALESAIEQERLAAFRERCRLPVPLGEESRQAAAFDGESDLVRSGEAIDGSAPGELARMLAADLVDEEQGHPNWPIRLSIGYGEADAGDRLPLELGCRRRNGHRDRVEAHARK